MNTLSNSAAQRRQYRQVGIIHIDKLSLGASCKIAYINTICLRCWSSCVLTTKDFGVQMGSSRDHLFCVISAQSQRGNGPLVFRMTLQMDPGVKASLSCMLAPHSQSHRLPQMHSSLFGSRSQGEAAGTVTPQSVAHTCSQLLSRRGLPGQF